MPFDRRASNEAEMPFPYAIGHFREFWAIFFCVFACQPTGGQIGS